MTEEIVDLMENLGTDADVLGTPVAIWTMGPLGSMAPLDPPVVGHVCGFEGEAQGGCHSIILIASPHGSTFRAGRVCVRAATPADLARLEKLTAAAARERT